MRGVRLPGPVVKAALRELGQKVPAGNKLALLQAFAAALGLGSHRSAAAWEDRAQLASLIMTKNDFLQRRCGVVVVVVVLLTFEVDSCDSDASQDEGVLPATLEVRAAVAEELGVLLLLLCIADLRSPTLSLPALR